MFPNLPLQQPKWTSVSVWNWSRKSMGCVTRSEDYLSLSENLLKYPKTHVKAQRSPSWDREREAVHCSQSGMSACCVRALNTPFVCPLKDQVSCFLLDNALSSCSSLSCDGVYNTAQVCLHTYVWPRLTVPVLGSRCHGRQPLPFLYFSKIE